MALRTSGARRTAGRPLPIASSRSRAPPRSVHCARAMPAAARARSANRRQTPSTPAGARACGGAAASRQDEAQTRDSSRHPRCRRCAIFQLAAGSKQIRCEPAVRRARSPQSAFRRRRRMLVVLACAIESPPRDRPPRRALRWDVGAERGAGNLIECAAPARAPAGCAHRRDTAHELRDVASGMSRSRRGREVSRERRGARRLGNQHRGMFFFQLVENGTAREYRRQHWARAA